MTTAHPAVLAALFVLLLNDHVLKHVLPGVVTGHLSDVAGPVVLAALLGDLLRRREAWGWWATAVVFASVKTWAHAVPAALGLSVVRDPWDLLGLLALPLAWHATRHPVPVRRGLRVAASALALLAVMATSAATYPRVDLTTVKGPGLVTVVDGETYASTDAGLTWRPTGEPPRGPVDGVYPSDAVGRSAGSGRHRYRIAGRDAVDESTDGGQTWHPSWRTPRADLRGRKRRSPGIFPFSHEDDFGQSGARSLLVVPGRDVVLVAFGREGLLRRDGNGPWQRVAVGPAAPPRPSGPLFPWDAVFGLACLAVMVTVVAVAVRAARASPRARTAAGAASSPRHRRTR